MTVAKYIAFIILIVGLLACDKEESVGSECDHLFSSLTVKQDTLLTISFGDSVQLTQISDVYLKFDKISDNCSLDTCGYCDSESTVHLSLVTTACSVDIPYFSFYKCEEKHPLISSSHPVCNLPDMDYSLAHNEFEVYGQLIFTIVDVNIYARDYKELVKYNTEWLEDYTITVSVKNRCG
ncbi:hypothetical protein [Imperialibacter sp. EC-SDR9]|uniref:hypothetical protein n=2 Tax=Imperialibacter TaxID=1649461 RepID=UPI001D0037F0|nr:hypothetical protein [Imperialibacter sp. EC-SDR9]